MFLMSTIAALLTTACLPTVTPDRPPPLTFDKQVDYIAWHNDFVSQGKTENAYELYQGLYPDKTHDRGIPSPEGLVREQLSKTKGRVWSPKDHAELADYLSECAPYLNILEKAVERQDYWQPAPPETKLLFAMLMPNPASSRTGAEAILARAWMKKKNQPKVMLGACRVVLRNADHMQQASWLFSAMVGIAERGLVYDTARAALAEEVITGKDIAKLFKMIRRDDPAKVNPSRPYYVEWASTLNTLQVLFPNGRFNAGTWKTFLSQTGAATDPASQDAGPFDPRATAGLIDDHFQTAIDIASGPLNRENANKLAQFETDQASKIQSHPFLSMMMPGFARSYLLQLHTEVVRRGTLLTLAIHAHHAKHGKWPKSLKKIDKKLGLKGLKTLRKDPLSGKSFKYKLKDGQPLLYSVGLDGKDDGGRQNPKWNDPKSRGDYVFWPYEHP